MIAIIGATRHVTIWQSFINQNRISQHCYRKPVRVTSEVRRHVADKKARTLSSYKRAFNVMRAKAQSRAKMRFIFISYDASAFVRAFKKNISPL